MSSPISAFWNVPLGNRGSLPGKENARRTEPNVVFLGLRKQTVDHSLDICGSQKNEDIALVFSYLLQRDQ